MNINLTLIGQTIAFAVFVWFCMKFVWPPIITALNERKTRIADGLAAADEGQREKARAEEYAAEALEEAIRRAERRETEIVEEAKSTARTEGDRILTAARGEIDKEINQAREALRAQLATLVVAGAGQILGREVGESDHAKLIDDLAQEL